ncbi:MAG: DUF11 domain-containing protein [Symploca sp. SIO2E9]|nr:DUF11 domain-containing protein [Symploca sp. SIO2E9]
MKKGIGNRELLTARRVREVSKQTRRHGDAETRRIEIPRKIPLTPAIIWGKLVGSLTLLTVTIGYTPEVLAQTRFDCDTTNYISSGSIFQTNLNSIETTQNTNNFDLQLIGSDVEYNAIGFNPVDGFIYGINPNFIGAPGNASSEQNRTVYRIGNNGTATVVGIPQGPEGTDLENLPNTGLFFAGDFRTNGEYVILSRGGVGTVEGDDNRLITIDVSTSPPTILSNIQLNQGGDTTFGNNPPQFADIAFNPAAAPPNSELLGFDSVRRQLARIDPITGDVDFFGTPDLTEGRTAGALFFNSLGELFAYTAIFTQENNFTPDNGIFFQVNLETGGFIGNGTLAPGVSRFDGAACAIAPNLQKEVTSATSETVASGETLMVTAGETVTYTYTLANRTISSFTGLNVSDTLPQPPNLPDALTYVDGSLTIEGFQSGTPNDFGGTSSLEITNLDLPANTEGVITVQVLISPNTPPGQLDNQVIIENIPPEFGGDPNIPSDDPNTPTFPDETTVQVTENPQIGVAKNATDLTNNGDGTFTVTYDLVVENLGNVALSNVQLTENLDETFGAGNFTVESVTSPNLATNPNFNASSDTNLLAGTDTLALAQVETLQLVVVVTPADLTQDFANQVEAVGTSPAGDTVNDLSDDGVEPDTDGDSNGNEPDENTPTVVNFSENPIIGTAKNAASVINNGDGSFTITYDLVVENLGNVTLNNVQLTENLDETFGAGNFTVSSLTSPNLATNPNFNASSDTNLLAGTDTLEVAQSETLQLVVVATPADISQNFNNQIEATGISPGGTPVNDLSDDGFESDPNSNGNPGDPDENTPTVVNFSENPVIGVAKNATTITDNGNGSFTVTYDLVVENLGDVNLSSLQLTENLDNTFGAGNFTVSSVTSPNLAINPNFDASSDTNLLAGTDTLAVAQSETLQFVVVATPPEINQNFDNQVQAAGTSPTGVTVNDISDDGFEPDSDNDNIPNEPDDNTPTVINFSENPVIGVAKNASAVTDNGDGSFTVTYDLVVENLGNVALSNVQLTENLDDTFGAGNFTVNSVTSPNLATNPNFNASSDTNLLAGTDTLAIAQSETLQFIVVVTPTDLAQDFTNQVEASGTSPAGVTVNDLSDDGVDADPDGDGISNEPDNNTPTIINFTENPVIGVAKNATAIADNGDGSFTITYDLVVENLGNVDLSNLQLTENLDETFGAGNFTVSSVTSPNLAINPNFDASSDTNLLAGTDTLVVAQRETIQFVVIATPPELNQSFNNQVEATAISQSGTPVNDLSNDGVEPDPDDNENPNEPENNIPTVITLPPTQEARLRLVKRITNVTRNGVTVAGVDFSSFIDDPNDNDDNAPGWAQLPPVGVITVGPEISLQSGDQVEYTIYFLSDGQTALNNVDFCDAIPEETAFIRDSFASGSGILLNQNALEQSQSNLEDGDQGRFIEIMRPGNPPCPETLPKGAVFVNLGNIPVTAGNNFGFVRFRVTID